MKDEIEPIIPPCVPIGWMTEKMKVCDCEGDCDCKRFSINDSIQLIKDISGVSEDLLGKMDD